MAEEHKTIATVSLYPSTIDFFKSKGINRSRLLEQVKQDIDSGTYEYKYI